MFNVFKRIRRAYLVLAAGLLLPSILLADADYDALQAQVETLAAQLEEVQKALARSQQDQAEQASARTDEIVALKKDIDVAAEWRTPNSLIHMAGYTDVGYVNGDNDDGSFNVGTFSPIFHFQYRDIVMFESELEFELSPDGETEVAMEYLTLDYFINDYVTLVGGLFLSPVGQFRQNLHPSWINKLPSAPPGFGHDGAAPTSEVGLQLRGAFPLGGIRSNYALYVGNGPELNSVFEDGEFELEGIEAEGFGTDRDGEKVLGGRFAILPISSLEIGVSGATGKATVTGLEDEDTGEILEIEGETARDYDVIGADFNWAWKDLSMRGEYVRSKIGETATGLTASESGEWTSWYSQAAWRFPSTKVEAVLRYTDFDSPHASHDQQQWVLGLNYLITSSFIAKAAYEFNDGIEGSIVNSDRLMLQLAYGF